MRRIENIIGFIPARGGSKGIKNKNICIVGGRPLIYYILDSAIASNCFKKLIVSTDCPKIKNIVLKYESKLIEIVDRNPNLAKDTSTTESVLLEYARRNDFDWMFLIQVTSPLTKHTDFQNAVDILQKDNADTLVTTVKQQRFRWAYNNKNILQPINYNPKRRSLRQQFNAVEYVENGAFYAFRKSGLLKHKSRLYGKIANCIMRQETYSELDDKEDLEIIEKLIINERDNKLSFNNRNYRKILK